MGTNMKNTWTLFVTAAFFGGWALISNGIPLMPVLLGIGAAAAFNLYRRRVAD